MQVVDRLQWYIDDGDMVSITYLQCSFCIVGHSLSPLVLEGLSNKVLEKKMLGHIFCDQSRRQMVLTWFPCM